jgi:hypothetical protein
LRDPNKALAPEDFRIIKQGLLQHYADIHKLYFFHTKAVELLKNEQLKSDDVPAFFKELKEFDERIRHQRYTHWLVQSTLDDYNKRKFELRKCPLDRQHLVICADHRFEGIYYWLKYLKEAMEKVNIVEPASPKPPITCKPYTKLELAWDDTDKWDRRKTGSRQRRKQWGERATTGCFGIEREKRERQLRIRQARATKHPRYKDWDYLGCDFPTLGRERDWD